MTLSDTITAEGKIVTPEHAWSWGLYGKGMMNKTQNGGSTDRHTRRLTLATRSFSAKGKTEQLLLDTVLHPMTARAFRDFDVEAVRGELHTQGLLAWLPQEERDRRIGRLVLRWRRARPEVVREREVGGSYQLPMVSSYVPNGTNVIVEFFGEREGLANQTATSLSQRVVEALDMIGLAASLFTGTMTLGRRNGGIDVPAAVNPAIYEK